MASGARSIHWLVSDQLGTPRMIFDKTGALANVKRHDYAPFGEELFNGLRTTAMGYAAADPTRQKFTSKERDIETGLEYLSQHARLTASLLFELIRNSLRQWAAGEGMEAAPLEI
jgi:hypothetical protein